MGLPPKSVLYSLALASLLTAGTPARARQADAGGPAKSSRVPAARPSAAAERTKAREYIYAFVDKAQSIQDLPLRIDTLVALASILWKDGGDAVYARQIFVDAHNFLKTFQPQEVKGSAAAATPAEAAATPSRKTLRLLRRRLIMGLAKFDPTLASSLAKEQDGYLDSPLDAEEYAERTRDQVARQDFEKFSGAQHLGRNEAMILLSILDEFRTKDVKAGDGLFLVALDRLRGQQNVEANSLLILGNYLFSGHPLPSNESLRRSMVSPVQVGGVQLAADVVLNRDDFSPSLVLPYLTAAAEILRRPVEDAGERRRYSAAAHLLAAKAKEFAPSLIAAFSAVAQAADAGLAVSPTGQTEVKRWANEKINLESALAQVRKTVGTKERDRLCLSLASQYSAQKDLDAAKRMAGEITDEAAREKLLSVLNYKQATEFLREGDTARAEEAGAGISSEAVRALFRLSLAAAHLRARRADAAKIAISNAVADARKSSDSARRPPLLMLAAATLSKSDAAYSLQLFREGLEGLDASGYVGRPPHIVEFGWVETVNAGTSSARFELRPGAGTASYQELLKNLFAGDRRSMVTAVSNLKTEALLSSHLVAAGRILLEPTRKEPAGPAATETAPRPRQPGPGRLKAHALDFPH